MLRFTTGSLHMHFVPLPFLSLMAPSTTFLKHLWLVHAVTKFLIKALIPAFYKTMHALQIATKFKFKD